MVEEAEEEFPVSSGGYGPCSSQSVIMKDTTVITSPNLLVDMNEVEPESQVDSRISGNIENSATLKLPVVEIDDSGDLVENSQETDNSRNESDEEPEEPFAVSPGDK
jgi:hypothetical protein